MNLSNKFWQWALLVLLAFIWGSSFILMKKGLESYSALQVASFRIFFSFVILIPFIIKNIRKLSRKNLGPILIVAFIGNAIPAFFYSMAQTQLNSSLAGMLNSLTPLFTMISGILLFSTRVSWKNVAGVIIGLIGASGLIVKDSSQFFVGNNWYALFIVMATLCYGININQVKRNLDDLDGLSIASLSFLFAGPVAGAILLFTDFSLPLATPGWLPNLGFIFMLALFSSVLAIIGFYSLVKHTTALFVSSVTYIIPIFAIGWGILDGEVISLINLIWICVILLGVWLVNFKKHGK
jgi:drug/metabolite transporter (DMT)-like permease